MPIWAIFDPCLASPGLAQTRDPPPPESTAQLEASNWEKGAGWLENPPGGASLQNFWQTAKTRLTQY